MKLMGSQNPNYEFLHKLKLYIWVYVGVSVYIL